MRISIKGRCMAGFCLLSGLILAFSGSSWADEHRVGMKNWEFNPPVLTIKVGDTVIWVNDDDSHHKIIFEDESIKGSNNIKPEQQFSLTFDKVGKHNYFCKYHRDYDMKGTIIVEGGN